MGLFIIIVEHLQILQFLFNGKFQNDNVTFVDIPGATAQNYTPPGTTTVGFRYFRRLVSPSSNIGVCFNPSNVISLETIATPPLSTPVIITPTNLQCDSFDANWNRSLVQLVIYYMCLQLVILLQFYLVMMV